MAYPALNQPIARRQQPRPVAAPPANNVAPRAPTPPPNALAPQPLPATAGGANGGRPLRSIPGSNWRPFQQPAPAIGVPASAYNQSGGNRIAQGANGYTTAEHLAAMGGGNHYSPSAPAAARPQQAATQRLDPMTGQMVTYAGGVDAYARENENARQQARYAALDGGSLAGTIPGHLYNPNAAHAQQASPYAGLVGAPSIPQPIGIGSPAAAPGAPMPSLASRPGQPPAATSPAPQSPAIRGLSQPMASAPLAQRQQAANDRRGTIQPAQAPNPSSYDPWGGGSTMQPGDFNTMTTPLQRKLATSGVMPAISPAAAGGSPGGIDYMGLYNQAQQERDQANAANEQRYQGILDSNATGGQYQLNDLATSYGGQQGMIDAYGNNRQQFLAGAGQNLANYGANAAGGLMNQIGAAGGALQQNRVQQSINEQARMGQGADALTSLRGNQAGGEMGMIGEQAGGQMGMRGDLSNAYADATAGVGNQLLDRSATGATGELGYLSGNEGRLGDTLGAQSQQQQGLLAGQGQRQQDFLSGQRDTQLGLAGATSGAEYERESRLRDAELGRLSQSMTDRGMTNTTVQDPLRARILDDSRLREMEIGDRQARLGLGIEQDYTGRAFGAMSGNDASVYGDLAGMNAQSYGLGRDFSGEGLNTLRGANQQQFGVAAGTGADQLRNLDQSGRDMMNIQQGADAAMLGTAQNANRDMYGLGVANDSRQVDAMQSGNRDIQQLSDAYARLGIGALDANNQQQMAIAQQMMNMQYGDMQNTNNQQLAIANAYGNNRAGLLDSLRTGREGVMERRTDNGPDMNAIYALLSQARGGSGGGYGFSGGGSGSRQGNGGQMTLGQDIGNAPNMGGGGYYGSYQPPQQPFINDPEAGIGNMNPFAQMAQPWYASAPRPVGPQGF